MPDRDDVVPTDAVAIKRRWVPLHRVEWVKHCDQLMLEYGAVTSQHIYGTRHQARWRAEYLIKLMVELEVHPRWHLRYHVDRKGDGFVWTVEYIGRDHE